MITDDIAAIILRQDKHNNIVKVAQIIDLILVYSVLSFLEESVIKITLHMEMLGSLYCICLV